MNTSAHQVAVLIKASLDAVMELDHIKNKTVQTEHERDITIQIVERGHIAINQMSSDPRVQTAQQILSALIIAEDFMAGFEDDEIQDGIAEKLRQVRAAIGMVTA
jgi:hypothetical protein